MENDKESKVIDIRQNIVGAGDALIEYCSVATEKIKKIDKRFDQISAHQQEIVALMAAMTI